MSQSTERPCTYLDAECSFEFVKLELGPILSCDACNLGMITEDAYF